MSARTVEHGNAALAGSPADVWATNGGIYLGRTVQGGTNREAPLAGHEGRRSIGREHLIRSTWHQDGGNFRYVGEGHVATVAPQGSGKTRKLLMPNLFGLRDWSCVVIDTKGELAAHTAVWRARAKNHRVVVIDPFRVMETNYPRLFARFPDIFKSHGFNPLRALDADHPSFVDDAKALAEALITIDGTHETHFPLGAQALVKGLLMVLRVYKPGVSDTLGTLRAVLGLTPGGLADFNKTRVTELKERWPAIAASLGEFTSYSADDREIGAIRRTAKIQTDWLDSPLFVKDLEQCEHFEFASLKKQPQTIYLILPPKRLANAVWLRLMVTSALLPLLDTVERSPVPVLFMLDEFAQLGPLPIIINNIAQLRGFGVKLWAVWQFLAQAQNIYKEGWEAFFATAGARVVFGPEDPTTREYFSKLSGERLFKHDTGGQSHSVSFGKGGVNFSYGGSSGEQHMHERVIKPHELAALDADEAMIYARRGQAHRTICPQPDRLPGVGEGLAMARHWIEADVPALSARETVS